MKNTALRIAIACLIGAGLASPGAQAYEAHLGIDQWPATRTGQALVALDPVRNTVHEYDAREQARIVIRYPGGDHGTNWAHELRDWLVALGIASGDLVLEPASGLPDTIVLQVIDAR